MIDAYFLDAIAREILAQRLFEQVPIQELLEQSHKRGWGAVTTLGGAAPLDDISAYGLLRFVGKGEMLVHAFALPDGYEPSETARHIVEIHTDLPLDITLKIGGLPILVAAQIEAMRVGKPPEEIVASIHWHRRERRDVGFAKWLLTEHRLRIDRYMGVAA